MSDARAVNDLCSLFFVLLYHVSRRRSSRARLETGHPRMPATTRRCPFYSFHHPLLFPGRGSRTRKRMAGGCAAEPEDRRLDEAHVHYNHTDPCSHLRWNARECYQYMYQRPWQRVSDFYAEVVLGHSSLHSLFSGSSIAATAAVSAIDESHESRGLGVPHTAIDTDHCAGSAIPAPEKERTGRWARTTFRVVLSYHGGSFDGWQKQPGSLNTVQGVVEKALGRFVDEKKAQQLKDRSLPVEGCALVAGRTDKGVTALRQVCSFYTWRKEVKAKDIEDAINKAAPGKLKTLFASEVSRMFHPNFSAKWRRYFYIFPLDDGSEQLNNDETYDFNSAREMLGEKKKVWTNMKCENERWLPGSDGVECESMLDATPKNKCFSVSKVNELLHQLEGKSLSYKMFARDTKASRSTGPPTECYVFHARAAEARLPHDDQDCGAELRVMCIELVANRFLRRMVRVLVATSVREAAAGAGDDALLKLMDATCRRATAPPAPPDGLCLVDLGYGEFRKEQCLIR
uniref:tRNA pseudouridine synthase A n=1 Tax=Anthurium amnicola TaxID=1678845 RepID=A0A1D1ZID8_9ARAE